MLNWPWNWLRKKAGPGGGALGIYDPGEMLIYRYKSGPSAWIDQDPMVLVKRVAAVGPELQAEIGLATSQFAIKGRDEAYEDVLKKLREIFAVPGFAEGGLTEAALIGLFNHFMAYQEGLKKNTQPPPTSAAGTPGGSPSPSEGAPPTPSGSGSGSTGAAPSAAPPTQPT